MKTLAYYKSTLIDWQIRLKKTKWAYRKRICRHHIAVCTVMIKQIEDLKGVK